MKTKCSNNYDSNQIAAMFLPEPVPDISRSMVQDVLLDGRLFRYDYQGDPDRSPTAILEKRFAERLGCQYALAVNSCGSAMQLALLSAGVRPGDQVLVPGFTFTAVISAITNCGCIPILVDIADDYFIDLNDLAKKWSPGVRFFLLSYMRGRVARLDDLLEFCASRRILVIEDCAHSLGTSWRGSPTGTFGTASCFSFHDKLLNSGEGGILTTDDDHLFMRAVVMSGTYERLWERHLSRPPIDNPYQGHVAQFSMRMSAVSAALLIPQVPLIDTLAQEYRNVCEKLLSRISSCPHIRIPQVDPAATLVSNTIQFELVDMPDAAAGKAVNMIYQAGVPLARFSRRSRNDRCVWNWHYLQPGTEYGIPRCTQLLNNTCDLRLRRTMKDTDLDAIGEILCSCIDQAAKNR